MAELMHRFFLQAAVAALLLLPNVQAAEVDGEIRLILQLTIDGLRYDLLTRSADHFGEGGLRYLLESGAVFTSAHYQHANTETIVGPRSSGRCGTSNASSRRQKSTIWRSR